MTIAMGKRGNRAKEKGQAVCVGEKTLEPETDVVENSPLKATEAARRYRMTLVEVRIGMRRGTSTYLQTDAATKVSIKLRVVLTRYL